MKLGLIVVYMVSEDNKKLLDIHLEKIKQNTTVPFTLYAGINILIPKFKSILEECRFVKICECDAYEGPQDEWKPIYEHSYYLEKLIDMALDDGVTHIAILHPDSFPIKRGWETYLTEKLEDGCDLISIFPEMSAFTFFKSNFYKKYKPTLLPNSADINKRSWKSFQKNNTPNFLIESGMGIAYKAYLEKLTWSKLIRSNKGEYHNSFGSVFEDVVFHLGSASDWRERVMKGHLKNSFINNVKTSLVQSIPTVIKNKIKNVLPQNVIYPEIKSNKETYEYIRNQLLNNTEKFLEYLRYGENIS